MENKENKFVKKDSYVGKSIAVLTSGGDAQGMNAAVRAVVRTALYVGCKPFFIREGYQGMVDGGSFIQEVKWVSVSSIIHLGGTIIGTARCMEFKEREGRKKAALNLVKNEITHLIVIGGDGSLTGANTFRDEWSDHLKDLLADGSINREQMDRCKILKIVGIVGSIDNDFCGTDMTIGTDTALHRILEAIDAITATAFSHQRTFVMEVMGRHCGYLSLLIAMACEADMVFIPEYPPGKNWKELLCAKCLQERKEGRRLNIIIVSEGAIDMYGNTITAQEVRDVIIKELKHDTRITVLGHVQRGGNPSAFDRILACRMGADAVFAALESEDNADSVCIALDGNKIVRLPLMDCVRETQAVGKALEEKNFDLALKLRGPTFERNLDGYKLMTRLKPQEGKSCSSTMLRPYNFAVVTIGAPACGMNAAIFGFVRNVIYCGDNAYGVMDSIDGLAKGNFKKLEWANVDGWVSIGGANLGSKHQSAKNVVPQIARELEKHKIDGLVLVGGFDAYQSAVEFNEAKTQFPVFEMPMVVIPATISNNVPGTEFSLGADTALNEITEMCDRIRQSAQGTQNRVFIIEVMGGYCGYLATCAGLAGGADAAYIYEEKFSINELQDDVRHMKAKMKEGVPRGLILRNELANDNYSADFIRRVFAEEGSGFFSTRMNILGHIQQGGKPSPFDRIMGIKLATKAVLWMKSEMVKRSTDGKSSVKGNCVLLGVQERQYKFTALSDVVRISDFKFRKSKDEWWLKLRPLLSIISKHESAHKEGNENVKMVKTKPKSGQCEARYTQK